MSWITLWRAIFLTADLEKPVVSTQIDTELSHGKQTLCLMELFLNSFPTRFQLLAAACWELDMDMFLGDKTCIQV